MAKAARPHPDQPSTDEADLEWLTAHASAIDIRDRALSPSQWDAVLAYVQSQPDSLGRARLHLVLTLAYGTERIFLPLPRTNSMSYGCPSALV